MILTIFHRYGYPSGPHMLLTSLRLYILLSCAGQKML